jgi:hypothetical protein
MDFSPTELMLQIFIQMANNNRRVVGEIIEAFYVSAQALGPTMPALIKTVNTVDNRVQIMRQMQVPPAMFAEAMQNHQHALGAEILSLMKRPEKRTSAIMAFNHFIFGKPTLRKPR